MKLVISNLAIIDYAEINIDGISIIAGENDTGKSTVGKALYSLQNSLYRFYDQVKEERTRRLVNLLSNVFVDVISMRESIVDFDIRSMNSKLLEMYYGGEIDGSAPSIKDFIFSYLDSENIKHKKTVKGIDEVLADVERTLSISDERILQTIIQRMFLSEIGDHVLNVSSRKSTGKVALFHDDGDVEIGIKKDNSIELFNVSSLENNAILIDNPFIIDDISRSQQIVFRSMMNSSIRHRNHLLELLLSSQNENDIGSALNELIIEDRLEEIFSKLNLLCDGEFSIKDRRAVYNIESLGTSLDIKSISSGLKTFIILKTLLQKNAIKENTTIILDEPEIHLHPQWQVSLAEILVLLQKAFKLKILITTHSPYFIDAIETYSMIFGTSEQCRYYISERKSEGSIITECTNDTTQIYGKLATPFQDLERIRDKYDR